MFKEGLGNFYNKEQYSNTNNEKYSIERKIISVRVLDVVLDDTHPKFDFYGGWNGIGIIEFENLDINSNIPKDLAFALPFNPNIKNYPLINEIVLLFNLPSDPILSINLNTTYYYLNSINVWNHPHHNACPNIDRVIYNLPQNNSYKHIEKGIVRENESNIDSIELNSNNNGGTFNEKSNIKPLLPYAGDIIYEGRFSNSIRFGSTAKTKSKFIKNNWSSKGENGDPITIIKNGQSLQNDNEGWVHTIENINKDLSSIYLTSYQSIPLNIYKEDYNILNNNIEIINQYNKPQILINSGRLVFNSNLDSIILHSKKNISLNSLENLGIQSYKDIILDSKTIRLGDKNADESVILGNTFMKQFENLLNSVVNLCSSLEYLNDYPGGVMVPNPIIPPMANNLKETSKNILSLIKNDKNPFLSNKTKTV